MPPKKPLLKVVRILLRDYTLVKGFVPPPLDIVLLEEDEDNFYGYPTTFDAIQRKLTFGHAMVGTYRKKPSKKDPSFWELTWRKSKQEQTA